MELAKTQRKLFPCDNLNNNSISTRNVKAYQDRFIHLPGLEFHLPIFWVTLYTEQHSWELVTWSHGIYEYGR